MHRKKIHPLNADLGYGILIIEELNSGGIAK